MEDKTICPCCGEHHFKVADSFERCPNCGWVDDPYQRDFPDKSGANVETLNEAKQQMVEIRRKNGKKVV